MDKINDYGWMYFHESYTDNVANVPNIKHGISYFEARCKNCGYYLGIYDPKSNEGKNYIINSVALSFHPANEFLRDIYDTHKYRRTKHTNWVTD